MRARTVAAALAGIALAGCKPEPPWGGYLPTEAVSLDCRVLPHAEAMLFLDPERPDELLGESVFTTDFGATWHRLYDGTSPARLSNLVYELGGGRWLEADLDPTSRVGRLVTLPKGLVVPVTLTATLAGPEGLVSVPLDDGTYAGLDVRGRVWTSEAGGFGTWVGREGRSRRGGPPPHTVARGDRVWHVRADGTVEASTDGGLSFTPRAAPTVEGVPLQADDVAFTADGRVLLSAYTWVWSSDDDGATWTIADAPSEFVERSGVGSLTAVGDDVYAEAELNLEAATPNPAGFYLLRTADAGATWSIVRLDDGLEGVPYNVSGRVWQRPDGRLGAVVFRPSGDRALCEAVATPRTRDDATVDAERVPPSLTVTAPADGAWTDPVRVVGAASPGSTVVAALEGYEGAFREGLIHQDPIATSARTTAGDDGQFVVDVSFPSGADPEIGSPVRLTVTATDGYVSSPTLYRDLMRGGAPVAVRLDAPSYTTRDVEVRVTGTPGAALALYEGSWVGWLDLRAIADAPTSIPASGEVTARVTLTHDPGSVSLYAVAAIPASVGMFVGGTEIAEPPAVVEPPEVALVLDDVVTAGFYARVRTAPHATFDWSLLDPSDAVLASDEDLDGGGASPDWKGFPVDYAEPASGTALRLRVVQEVLGVRSPPTELALTQR